jgi:sigma-B regulation protein RsbU (phosphoserine phosphatase)
VVGKRESVLTSDAQRDDRFRGQDSVVVEQVRSALCVPLRNDEKVVGLLYVDSRREIGLFSEEDLRVLAHLASVAAVKIENHRLLEQARRDFLLNMELDQAATLQENLLPARGPEIPGYRISARSIPCRGVGGDCFDFVGMPEGRHAIGLGDVAGRGLPAALLMCYFHAGLHVLAGLGLSEEQTFTRLNRLLCPRFPPNRFVTSFYGVLDPRENRLTYVNAGQDPPFLIRGGSGALQLPILGMPLGLFEESRYESGAVDFAPGDVLLCYSDGATEGESPSGEMFGAERLLSAARGAREGSPEEIISAITDEIEKHHAGRAHEDDITLLVLKRTG